MLRFNLWWVMMITGLLPFCGLVLKIALDNLGANPVQAVHYYLGLWSIRFLCLSLAVSPLRKITSWKWPLTYRRMIGLFTFFYTSLHVFSYLVLDHALVWQNIAQDMLESPYIFMGLCAYMIILPMAITSTKAWQKRLGSNWKKLHRFVYLAGVTAVIHYFWQLKGNLAEPLLYSLIVALLLGFRVVMRYKK
jgi:methionine sulfoxide reductase heme-binding subunit